jgi:FtsP/CotA-like multicopper oxidase with cupredoxin domain
MGSLLLAVNPTSLARADTKEGDSSTGSSDFEPDLEVALVAAPGRVAILPGQFTNVWQFHGEVLKGDPGSLQTHENTYLGPVFRVRKGQKIRVHFRNEIAEESIVHFHGLHVPAVMDGHPRYVVPQGGTYVYEFEVRNRAGTYWYHPHPHDRTGPQVYYGMAGLFLVTDDEESSLPLPGADHDIPLVLQDRAFDGDNQLVYLGNGMMGGMMERMQGFIGNQVLVNGHADFSLSVATRAYRLRLLNGSNSRIYKLAWNDGTPMIVIGTDGGLLGAPIRRDYVVLGPGQRLELWADFSDKPIGARIALRTLEFSAAMAGNMMAGGMMGRGMMGGRMGGYGGLPNGADFTVMTVTVDRRETESLRLPERLADIKRHDPQDAVNYTDPRTVQMLMSSMNWTINGRSFEMTAVANDERVRMGTLEMWELVNAGGMGRGMMGMMMGMTMPHPIHLHGEQFQVYERASDPATNDDWLSLQDGVVDAGWQDVVMLFPGQRVKILRRFDDFEGLFLYHCHNLEHEDMGMMRNFLVEK